MYISELVFYAIENLKTKGFNTGRTNIQKLIFFSIKDKEELLRYYEPYHYGPYSEDVQISIQAIAKKNIIKYQNNNGYMFTDNYSFEDALKLTKHNDPKYSNNIKKEVDFLHHNKITTVKDIATLAKIHYYYITTNKTDSALVEYIEESAPHTWPTLVEYKSQFSKYIDCAKRLHSELA